jgi:hypothetical protein
MHAAISQAFAAEGESRLERDRPDSRQPQA